MFFYFFDFSNEFVNPLSLSDSERTTVRERLNKETNAQGLRNVELAELTGWSTSKVSKATSGKQKLTDDDIRIWARALGYTVSPFLDPDCDMRSFKLMEHVRDVTTCLRAYLESEEGTPEHSAIINYELPLSILGSLDLNPANYAIRTSDIRIRNNPFGEEKIIKEGGYVRIWHRGTVSRDQVYPELYFGISPYDDSFSIVLYLNRNGSDEYHSLRQTYKDILQKDDEDKEWFDDFAKENEKWLSTWVGKGEISSFSCRPHNGIPDISLMIQVLIKLFKEYYEIVWQMKGMDLMPKHLKECDDSELPDIDPIRMLTANTSLDPLAVEKVLKSNHCQCEMDPEHKTFPTENGSQYMEVVPIVPLTLVSDFGKALLEEMNGACLCPTCWARLLHGKRDDREAMIMDLYTKHKDGLRKAGIKISLSELLHMYDL